MKWYVAIKYKKDDDPTIVEFNNRVKMIKAVDEWKKEGVEVVCVWSEATNE